MKTLSNLSAFLLLGASLLAQTATVTKTPGTNLIKEDLVIGAGRTLTLSGVVSGTPTSGTLDLTALTLTLPTATAGLFQPIDSDLTAIAALATTSTGRALLTATAATNAGLGLTNGANIDAWGAKTIPSGTVVGTTDTQTLSNKTLTAPVLGVASATSVSVTGTAGAGFVELPNQSANPSAPSSGGRMFYDSIGRLVFLDAIDGKQRIFYTGALSANRAWTFPDASGTVALTQTSAANYGITNGAAIDALGAVATSGALHRTGAGTYSARTLMGTTGQITVTNGDGVSGNPTISLPSTITQATTFSGGATTLSPASVGLVISPQNYSQAAWGGSGARSRVAAVTITDSSTATSGTATLAAFDSYAVPVLAATNTGVTTTNVATVYIVGGPTAGTNQTITNSWGLYSLGYNYFQYLRVGTGNLNVNNRLEVAGSGRFSTSGGNVGAALIDQSGTASAGRLVIYNGSGTPKIILDGGGPSTFSDTTAATSTTTGALQVAGGVGVQGAGYFGGDVTVSKTSPNLSLVATGAGSLSKQTFTTTSGGDYIVGATGASAGSLLSTGGVANSFVINSPSATLPVQIGTGGTARVNIDNSAVAIIPTTEATTGGAGSLTTAGGIYAAKKIVSNSDIVANGVVVHRAYTVAGLPDAASYTYGTAFVSDATNAAGTGLGTAPTGGGSVKRMVYSDGASWLLL